MASRRIPCIPKPGVGRGGNVVCRGDDAIGFPNTGREKRAKATNERRIEVETGPVTRARLPRTGRLQTIGRRKFTGLICSRSGERTYPDAVFIYEEG